jgi:predicted MPP superfamily phosphohydrolase
LDNGLQNLGWTKLHDLKIETEVAGTTLELRGTDDAHLKLDRYERVKGRPASVDISLGVTHAPYKRILDAMSLDGLDLIFSGHTHGGQIRIPWFGKTRSLTTNCDLPNWRSRGLTKIEGEPWLHVSAGLGTNPWTPVRFLCEPEISLLNLIS